MNIREMRAQLGDTQSEFSARYHIPFRTVQNWETGMRKPPEYVSDLLEQRIKEDLTTARPCPCRSMTLKRRIFRLGAAMWARSPGCKLSVTALENPLSLR